MYQTLSDFLAVAGTSSNFFFTLAPALDPPAASELAGTFFLLIMALVMLGAALTHLSLVAMAAWGLIRGLLALWQGRQEEIMTKAGYGATRTQATKVQA